MQLPDEVAELIWEKSNGLPEYCEQLVVYLRNHVADQASSTMPRCRLLLLLLLPGWPPVPCLAALSLCLPEWAMAKASCHGRLSLALSLSRAVGAEAATQTASELPHILPPCLPCCSDIRSLEAAVLDFIRNRVTIHSTITDCVDRLRPEEQLLLKVASVCGLTIYADLLQAAHPQHPRREAVEACLASLEAANFMRQDAQEPSTWQFCQVRRGSAGRLVVGSLVGQRNQQRVAVNPTGRAPRGKASM